MSATQCPRCGRELPAEAAAEGLCPRCLLERGLGEAPPAEEESTLRVPERSEPLERIGPYRLLERLGEGGMGVVYLAEQREPIRRRVALKVIKVGLDSEEVLRRFEAERQALALMDHPGIAKVFDAGVAADGRPYFVMEHVSGVPITEYCDLRCLSVRHRLELVAQVCEALQHAHRRGLIHRDIKPSNVLVGASDDAPRVKIIDFGVAKSTGQRLVERTLFTQRGVLIGTPEYMSPEQAGTTELEIDERTDVYSLGVVLYELLVGALPFEPTILRRAAVAEMLRILREEDPPTPTMRLRSLGAARREVAEKRGTDAASLARHLRGDLDWIVMKALEKDPRRRYGSCDDLAADLRRHLADEPVAAGPPSLVYRFRKLLRRHRGVSIAVGSVATVVLVAIGLAMLSKIRSEQALERSLRWTLEQAIAEGTDIPSTSPNWRELERRLRRAVKEDPDGELAWLARRAVAQVEVSAPRFGLLSNPPKIDLRVVYPRIDLGTEYLFTAQIEGSWDGGPWVTVGSCYAHRRSPGWGGGHGGTKMEHVVQRTRDGQVDLGDIGGRGNVSGVDDPEPLTPAPHRLELRAQLAWLDPSFDIYPGTYEYSLARCSPRGEPIDQFWPGVERVPVQHRETRALEPLSIHLFEEYPANFPTPLSESDVTGRLTDWFAVDEVRLLRFTWPDDDAKEVWFSRPRFPLLMTIGVEGSMRWRGASFLGFELVGRLHEDTPLPIAARASLHRQDSAEAIVSFDLALGAGALSIGPEWIHHQLTDGDGAVTQTTVYDGSRSRIKLDQRTSAGSFTGRLHLEPSRELAIRTGLLDRFLGESTSIPTEIQVVDVRTYSSEDELNRALLEGREE